MTDEDAGPTPAAQQAIGSLRALLAQIDRGEIDAAQSHRAYLAGVLDGLTVDPVDLPGLRPGAPGRPT